MILDDVREKGLSEINVEGFIGFLKNISVDEKKQILNDLLLDNRNVDFNGNASEAFNKVFVEFKEEYKEEWEVLKKQCN